MRGIDCILGRVQTGVKKRAAKATQRSEQAESANSQPVQLVQYVAVRSWTAQVGRPRPPWCCAVKATHAA
eukprot:3710228-Pleurochrysis_carterae.AAC.1